MLSRRHCNNKKSAVAFSQPMSPFIVSWDHPSLSCVAFDQCLCHHSRGLDSGAAPVWRESLVSCVSGFYEWTQEWSGLGGLCVWHNGPQTYPWTEEETEGGDNKPHVYDERLVWAPLVYHSLKDKLSIQGYR